MEYVSWTHLIKNLINPSHCDLRNARYHLSKHATLNHHSPPCSSLCPSYALLSTNRSRFNETRLYYTQARFEGLRSMPLYEHCLLWFNRGSYNEKTSYTRECSHCSILRPSYLYHCGQIHKLGSTKIGLIRKYPGVSCLPWPIYIWLVWRQCLFSSHQASTAFSWKKNDMPGRFVYS